MGRGEIHRWGRAGTATLILATTLVLVGPAELAAAHGNCGPAAVYEMNGTFITEYYDPNVNPKYIKGQTKFYCTGYENHEKMYVQIKLFRCKAATPTACADNIKQVAADHATCPRGGMCQKTITTTCTPGYLYIAYGRWAAYTVSGVREHKNPSWPDLDLWSGTMAGLILLPC